MAQLLIKYKSQDYAELELDSSQEYIIGRDPDADIPLEGDKSLSRKHSKLYYDQQEWFVKKISQSGQIFCDNKSVEEQALRQGCIFIIDDFSFIFTEDKKEPADESLEADNLQNTPQPDSKNDPAALDLDQDALSEQDTSGPKLKQDADPQTEALDQTTIIKNTLSAQLSIYKPGQKVSENVKLTKTSWVIGRDKDCNSCINYKKLSRYHFEITKELDAYWLTDLGSSNGTKLNGKKLKKNESQKLSHNDTIAVKHLKINFEIINDNFKNFQLTEDNAPQDSSTLSPKDLKSSFFEVDKKYYLYGAITLIAFMALMFASTGPKQSTKNAQSLKQQKLTSGQIQLLEDNLRLAQTHYTSGKYRLCSTTLKTMHASVQYYKNSKQLAQYCEQAYQLRQEQKERQQKADEKERLNNRIIAIVHKCKTALQDKTLSTKQLNACLYPAIEIDPNHPDVSDLQGLIESEEIKTVELALKKTRNKKSKQAGVAKYQKALNLYKNKKWRLSIKAFNLFINSSHYGVANLKTKAKNQLKLAKTQFALIIKSSLFACKTLLKNKKYKKAAHACKKVLSQDPDNKLATNWLQLSIKKSYKELKEIYKNSVFEESVGSIELAKKMWEEMVNKGIAGEEYYQKASRKLKKYEGL